MVFRAHRLFVWLRRISRRPALFLENSILDIVLLKRILALALIALENLVLSGSGFGEP